MPDELAKAAPQNDGGTAGSSSSSGVPPFPASDARRNAAAGTATGMAAAPAGGDDGSEDGGAPELLGEAGTTDGAAGPLPPGAATGSALPAQPAIPVISTVTAAITATVVPRRLAFIALHSRPGHPIDVHHTACHVRPP
jgi:hypothetical protein